ncbi:hypothetical protein [Variovorax sp. YR752]|uniref:hypothetical protein n=1 Tax=Variovorax sp. YR752 TaxID=1884383 RepID=UPI003137A2F2
MLRVLVLLLIAANLLFYAWTNGWLDSATGLRPHPEREPERLSRQVHPERITVLPPGAASAAALVQPAASTAPASAPLRGACLEAGPFATGASVSAIAALQAVQPPLPAGSWAEVKIERPGSWMLYMGRFPNREVLAKKEDEIKRTRVAYQEVTTPTEYTMGFSLGRFDDRASAERGLEQIGQRGVRSARIVELAAPATLHVLRADNADAALAAQLTALRSPALGRGFVPCGG